MPQPHGCHKNETFALVALGGNTISHIGPPESTLLAALKCFESPDLMIGQVSHFYQTPCFPPGAGPDYVNAAISLSTRLSAQNLLQRLHEVEAEFGRERIKRWGTRTLDLDLLAFDQQILPDWSTFSYWRDMAPDLMKSRAPEELILPHPRLHERAFVLVPLNDVAPAWRHPVLKQSVAEMLAALPTAETAQVKVLQSD